MARTHTLGVNWTGGGESINQNVALSADSEVNVDETVPLSTTNMLVNFAFTYAQLISVYMLSDVTITMKTNSTSAPDDTITLTAGVPRIWYTGMGTCPFTANVTKVYLTNGTGGGAAVKLRFLVDATP